MKKMIAVLLLMMLACFSVSAFAEQEVMVGDIVFFGSYEIDNNLDNGREPIEWIVLDVRDGKALLLSKYCLDAKAYHNYNKEKVDITWEDCTLRAWLNGAFLESSFTEYEKKAILLTDVDNSDAQGNSEWDTTGGNNTQDYVFLLSHHEAFDVYFSSDEDRLCIQTEYAVANGAWVSTSDTDFKTAGAWWLRSPGRYQNYAAYVYSYGSRDNYHIYYDYFAVRPALWVNLESDPF